MFRFNRLEVKYMDNDDLQSHGSRRFKCKLCSFTSPSKQTMGRHYDNVHRDSLPPDVDGYRYFYYLLTGKEHGSCIICKSITEFNRATMKYSRFCDNPRCKQSYREQFKNRMIGKYGKIHLLSDPDHQKKMLAGRRISGEYTWSDRSTKLSYTASYELDFLKLLDEKLRWKSSDIMAPSPHVYEYVYEGDTKFYMPDYFIPSLNLEVEIKDDGSAKNINPVSREKDKIKDELMRSNGNYFNYIKIVNKDYDEFLALIKEGPGNG